jgi:4-diphosphocytidyl-2-C-methyl-D-erythritol kinase
MPENKRIISLLSPAKINLGLEVLHRRTDGYHEIRTIMQTLAWGDMIHVSKSDTVAFHTATSALAGKHNLCYRAAQLMADKYGATASVELEKNIPWGAGLGGGSSNAATVIMALNELYQLHLSDRQMAETGAELGSDVPFFFFSPCALVGGRGEALVPLENTLPLRHVLLVLPDLHLSTASMYKALKKGLTESVEAAKLDGSFAKMTLAEGWHTLRNDFERVAMEMAPQLREIPLRLSSAGCELVQMSGSGSAFYGLSRAKISPLPNLEPWRVVQTHFA